ncbi:class I SAM-dependent methyltransferase [Clostridium beijerinckii]|uniref:Ubiquinone/menaquinone biosynthesis C-methylase UbiE n=2 Tax=Clostridium beijerinckii TaxID=1520 RepID=A0A9Q5CU60_CLOBE|nr:class I SAM-dependent methyltransferase [Clostridium beijerinckii]AQS06501.1 methyltransferase domain protein [Clostridium beijerinckii]MBA2885878.1 ubiquinone/menaquinone biosynthesis C-methylase UbiE [Clostridium beijerinckii]MBA2900421.1 ubiquinone/menaquinone biosynthesis C-methylase UbiE [Clostridium beijerinckii]MBA2910437.1 ubiquinone/menaquinone biosynthesis C-methylase UbiE [Clostridium beijerinckii]MBA9013879.1 ubiquinone/menaquinone biosynthesis C-methylase UbiE [Clostridium beij
MDYIKSNKDAWEEAFERRAKGWSEDLYESLQNETYPFLKKELIEELLEFDFTNKTVSQFCCNNGRELLSIMKFGAKQGVGFDIAENMVSFANETAKKAKANCLFIATNILDIDEKFNNSFDFIFITIGALIWFKDLNLLFDKVSLCLKSGGILVINETHPVTNMLAASGENNYDKEVPNKLVNSYFKEDPWIENSGMSYMSEQSYKSKTFYSYSHTFSDIVNSLSSNKIVISKLREFQYDMSTSFANLNNLGIPLSYILIAKKID